MDKEHPIQLETVLDRIKKEIPELVAVVLFGTFGTQYDSAKRSDLIDLREASILFRFQTRLAPYITLKLCAENILRIRPEDRKAYKGSILHKILKIL